MSNSKTMKFLAFLETFYRDDNFEEIIDAYMEYINRHNIPLELFLGEVNFNELSDTSFPIINKFIKITNEKNIKKHINMILSRLIVCKKYDLFVKI